MSDEQFFSTKVTNRVMPGLLAMNMIRVIGGP